MKEDNKRGGAIPDALNNQGQNREEAPQNSKDGETPIFLTGNSTLQTGDEHRHDQSVDPRRDSRTEVNRDDQHEIRAGRLTGRDDDHSDNNTNA
ncbi:MAG: hypothetical protein EOP50_08435 [Sphingobacteriales bacterium]|nr:MAG: hypothetical protein EOP50_08435 [Sphingobacteriales bacterium]